MSAKILIIEDEDAIADALTYNLEKEGYSIQREHDGRRGLSLAVSSAPALIILDLMLPGMDGLQVCRTLKSDHRTREIAVLMLTARGAETDEIAGFNVGADDYVSKPFRITPLIQRVKALLRRNDKEKADRNRITLHGIEIDRAHHAASMEGTPLDLTPTEFRMLWTLMNQPGRPFSRGELMETSRGDDANSLERTIDVHVRSLRKKLGPLADMVETVRGIGYRFQRR
jgi:two-component system, OmpR family, phosphate regulon response regulator PhoB